MVRKNIAIIGAGTVGFSLVKLLKSNLSQLKKDFGVNLSLTFVCDKNKKLKKELSALKVGFTDNVADVIENPDIDIVVELIGGLHPAKEFVVRALKNGKDVVTANKALLATYGNELFALAKDNDCSLKFEAAVAGAIPIIKPLVENLALGKVSDVYGILNGTTNYVLYNMAQYGLNYSDVLKDAQEKGYAEADPTTDVKGHDALHKICVLSHICFGKLPDLKSVFCQGIDEVSAEDIQFGKENGLTIKLLAVLKKVRNELEVRVHPTFVPDSHPIAKIDGVLNAVFVNTEKCGPFLFSGFGAGGDPTAMSVLSDILDIARDGSKRHFQETTNKISFKDIGTAEALYYLRFSVVDKPGVLSKISSILADNGISIDSVEQKGVQKNKNKYVPLIILTHKAVENNIRKAVKAIDKLSITKQATQVIRIEEL